MNIAIKRLSNGKVYKIKRTTYLRLTVKELLILLYPDISIMILRGMSSIKYRNKIRNKHGLLSKFYIAKNIESELYIDKDSSNYDISRFIRNVNNAIADINLNLNLRVKRIVTNGIV